MKVEVHVKVDDDWLYAIEKDGVEEPHIGHAVDVLSMEIVKGLENMKYKNDYANARPAKLNKDGSIITEDDGSDSSCKCSYCEDVTECKPCETVSKHHCKKCHIEYHQD